MSHVEHRHVVVSTHCSMLLGARRLCRDHRLVEDSCYLSFIIKCSDRLQGRQQSKRDVESVSEPETDLEDDITTTTRSVDDDMLERERRDAESEDDYDDESVEDEDYEDSYLVDYEEEYSTTADGLLKDFVKIL